MKLKKMEGIYFQEQLNEFGDSIDRMNQRLDKIDARLDALELKASGTRSPSRSTQSSTSTAVAPKSRRRVPDLAVVIFFDKNSTTARKNLNELAEKAKRFAENGGMTAEVIPIEMQNVLLDMAGEVSKLRGFKKAVFFSNATQRALASDVHKNLYKAVGDMGVDIGVVYKSPDSEESLFVLREETNPRAPKVKLSFPWPILLDNTWTTRPEFESAANLQLKKMIRNL